MDEEALDAALKTLANLQQEGILIGIISCCRVAGGSAPGFKSLPIRRKKPVIRAGLQTL
ncbi:hypothetical protein [Nitrosomonas eutropha]|uniref:hypothetical protein n=1 Tax=Nitrosomonas eutropha TaxID=916 RepID=UPI0015A33FED|nr:hypothetical protein [Nitrosomonas eutropha]